jgi:hypothetical protein
MPSNRSLDEHRSSVCVQCIELLHRGCKGHWGKYGYMYMGCYTDQGLEGVIQHRGVSGLAGRELCPKVGDGMIRRRFEVA